jgi:CBS-domain-containing membrane protein
MDLEETPVTEIMQTVFERVHPATPIADIYASFSQRGCCDVIVCDDDGHFLGIITEMDLLSAISPGVGIRGRRKMGCLQCFIKSGVKHAREVMSREHISIKSTASVADAMIQMEKNRHPDVIVIDAQGVALGLIEMCDIISFLIRAGTL